MGAFLRYQTGSPLTKLYFNIFDGGYTLRRSSQGTDPAGPNHPQAIA